MNARLRSFLVLTLLVMVTVAGCAPKAAPTPTAAPKPTAVPPTAAPVPIKIGVNLELSGDGAFIGNKALDGVKLANKLKPTVLGRPVELVICDNRTDKTEGVNCMSRLIQNDKVAGVVAPLFSSLCIAAGDINENAKVPAISATSTNPLSTKDRKYFYRACAMDDDKSRISADFAVSTLKAKTAATVYELTNEASIQAAVWLKERWIALGKDASTLTEITYRGGDTDFSAQVSVLAQKKPDVIFWPGQVGAFIMAAQQAHAVGFYPQWIGNEAFDVPELTELGKQDVEGVYFVTHYHPQMTDSAVATAFNASCQKEFGRLPGAFEATGADCYYMLLEAMTRAGSTDGVAMTRELEGLKDFPGVSGPITMGPTHNPAKALVMLQVKSGKVEYLMTIPPSR